MATAAQIAANRRNAQKSTGPRTAAGKKRSSQNARKHGLFSRAALPDGPLTESSKAFQSFLNGMFEEWQPHTLQEKFWVERAALSLWRTQRAYRMEASAIQSLPDPDISLPACLPKIVRYENMLDRQLHQALAALARSKTNLGAWKNNRNGAS